MPVSVNDTCCDEKPLVTVLMSVYNGADFVGDAVNSILQQTYTNFEYLIINDHSTDSSKEIVEKFCDKRIRIVSNDANLGLAASLNIGIRLSKSKYIARMDADDISDPQRLAIQLDFMESHPDVGVCGTWVKTFGDGDVLEWQYGIASDDIKSNLLFESPFAHPSVMFRRSILIDSCAYYNETLHVAQDYDLWARLFDVTKFANIPSFLYYYRRHQSQVGQKKSFEQAVTSKKVRHFLLSKLAPNLAAADLEVHETICSKKYIITKEFVDLSEKWLLALLYLNNKTGIFPEYAFGRSLAHRWLDVCMNSTQLGFWMIKKILNSPLSGQVNCPRFLKMRLLLSCVTYNKLPWINS
ncbi:glycosyltransferase [Geobacter anodireducens]